MKQKPQTTTLNPQSTQIPYNGGNELWNTVRLPPVEETVYDWALKKNNCTAGPAVTYQRGIATCRTWSGCNEGSDVEFCTLAGMPHCWPGRLCVPRSDAPLPYPATKDLDANDEMWRFFSRFQLPVATAAGGGAVGNATGGGR